MRLIELKLTDDEVETFRSALQSRVTECGNNAYTAMVHEAKGAEAYWCKQQRITQQTLEMFNAEVNSDD